MLRQGGAGRLGEAFGLVVVEFGRHTVVQPQLGQLDGFLAGGQGAARDGQQLLVGQQGVPAVGHGGHQADLGALAGFLGGQVLGQGLLLQGRDTAEEVDFPGRHGQAHLEGVGVLAAGVGLAGTRGHAVHNRVLAGAGDLELGPGLLDVEHRHPQVAVVFQRDGDQLLQARVGEVVLPGQVGRGHTRSGGRRGLRERGGHWCGGPFIGRDHAAAGQQQGGCQQGQALQGPGGRLCHGAHPFKHG